MNRGALTPLEVATGMVLGTTGEVAHDEVDRPHPRDPLAALDSEILPALLRPPCLVSFSGGRDSTAVLAAATSLARREGLPVPIPITNVFPAAPASDERGWQEQAVRHLGLPDWVRLEHTDELDVIGPYAQRVLRAHGLVWPSNVHLHLPLLDVARGGSMLTGIGGDELFLAARQVPPPWVLSGAARARPRALFALGFAFMPRPLRRAVIARQAPVDAAWLRPRGRRAAKALMAADGAAEPRRLRERMAWWRRLRYLDIGVGAMELTARDTDVHLAHPLLARPFWRAVGAVAAPRGFASRTEGTRRLFGTLLPESIVARTSKASFQEPLWTARCREFALTWDGSGVPAEWVDAQALARHWREERPSAQTFTLLQAAWLALNCPSPPGDARAPRAASPSLSAC